MSEFPDIKIGLLTGQGVSKGKRLRLPRTGCIFPLRLGWQLESPAFTKTPGPTLDVRQLPAKFHAFIPIDLLDGKIIPFNLAIVSTHDLCPLGLRDLMLPGKEPAGECHLVQDFVIAPLALRARTSHLECARLTPEYFP